MKKLLAYLMSIAVAFAAPLAEAVERSSSGQTIHTAVHASTTKKKAKVSGKHKKKVVASKAHKVKAKASVKAKAKVKAKSKVKARASHRRVVARSSEERSGRSVSLAAAQAGGSSADGSLALRSGAVLVIDQNTGEALYAKNPDVATPIASITKLMTSMVVLDAGLAMSEDITVTMDDVDRVKYSSSRLAVGTRLSREELLNLALIASENRAAAALSRAYPGGREAFVRAMNRRAAVLGMGNTWFVDGTGLDSSNRSTAADLAKLVVAAYEYPAIRRITSTGQYGISVPGRKVVKIRDHGKTRRVARDVVRHVAFHNTNALTRNPAWDIGVSKTGFINEAGHCLVMQANIADRKVIMVLLDSWGKLSRIGDAARIRKWLEGGNNGRLVTLETAGPV